METTELLPGRLTMLRFAVGQAYVWQDPGSLTLIDTGPPGSGEAIAEAVRGLGYQPSDVRHVILTHFHDDHAGAAADAGSWGNARVFAHRLDAPVIRGETPGAAPDFTEAERELYAHIVAASGGLPPAPPARVDVELADADELDFGGGATVIAVPGHTDGSIAVHLPAHRLLFTGDTVARATDGQVILGPFNVDRERAGASFRKLVELDADIACFGHGDPVVGGGQRRGAGR